FLMPDGVMTEAFDGLKWAWIFETSSPAKTILPEHFDLAYVILKESRQVVNNLNTAGIQTIQSSSNPVEGQSIVETICHRLSLSAPEKKPYLERLRRSKAARRAWIGPGSGSRKKNASIRIFSQTYKLLRNHFHLDLVVTLGEPDMWLLEDSGFQEFVEEAKAEPVANTLLDIVVTTYCNSCIYVGNDSGVSHLAAALGIPSIVFFKTTSPEVWGPWTTEENLLKIRLREDSDEQNPGLDKVYSQVLLFAEKHLSNPVF
ncbi:MAG: glycosyltransferase family 9 protein, partial [Desulfomonilaceae bacterium]